MVPESNMPGYPWLQDAVVDADLVRRKMRTLQKLGDPYSEQEIDAAQAQLEGKTEMDAVIAYLQGLGRARSGR